MRNWLIIAAVAMVAALAGCNTNTTNQPSLPDSSKGDGLASAGLQIYWQANIKLDGGERIKSAYLFPDEPAKTWVIYYLTTNRRVICYDAVVGTERWAASITDAGQALYAPTQGPDVSITRTPQGIGGLVPERGHELNTVTFHPMAINTEETIFLIDRMTGEVFRRIAAHGALTAGGCMNGQTYFAPAAENGAYLAYSFQEGVLTNWRGSLGGSIKAAPVYEDDHVFVGGSTGQFHCTRVGAGYDAKVDWQKDLSRGILASVVVDRNACYVPVEDGRLYAFDARTGTALWTHPFTTEQPLENSPQVSSNTLFQFSAGDKFYAIDPTKGAKRWDNPTAKTVLMVVKQDVYAIDTRNSLLVMDEAKGSVKATVSMDGFGIYAANTKYSGIFIASASGRIACIRTLDAGRLTPEVLTSTQPAKDTTTAPEK